MVGFHWILGYFINYTKRIWITAMLAITSEGLTAHIFISRNYNCTIYEAIFDNVRECCFFNFRICRICCCCCCCCCCCEGGLSPREFTNKETTLLSVNGFIFLPILSAHGHWAVRVIWQATTTVGMSLKQVVIAPMQKRSTTSASVIIKQTKSYFTVVVPC